MIYPLVLKAVDRNVQHVAMQCAVHMCKRKRVGLLIHTPPRAVCASSGPSFRSTDGLTSVTAGLMHAQLRSISLETSCRNKSKPEERESGPAAVSRYQSGTPSTAQKVKEAGRDFTYLIVVLIGLGVTGGLLYVVFQELFSSSSPNKVYGKAFNKVKSHPEVIGAFGEPIKCYGETTRRGRRQQVSHLEYLKEGLKHMRLKFYIEGSEPGLKGTVHSESKENPETGKYEFRYIFVDVDTYPRRTIIVEDNR
ncbi:mitochondrial import inner membrane translocase subunit Tim21-like isoform X1 [Lampris incognitus]|uniref:mitochondrial import inner membrane translocase subunit Tim21-like isoform X1 n=1 Tax=Lampris incognitus TaxID=2546036 RepID=UPI0024B5FCF0|nr:mitochondrial import inner membrane translocase subunit Tim21-like isoform X1 [Lampris incognitus]